MQPQIYSTLMKIEYGVYGDPIITYPKPYSVYLRETIHVDWPFAFNPCSHL